MHLDHPKLQEVPPSCLMSAGALHKPETHKHMWACRPALQGCREEGVLAALSGLLSSKWRSTELLLLLQLLRCMCTQLEVSRAVGLPSWGTPGLSEVGTPAVPPSQVGLRH